MARNPDLVKQSMKLPYDGVYLLRQVTRIHVDRVGATKCDDRMENKPDDQRQPMCCKFAE